MSHVVTMVAGDRVIDVLGVREALIERNLMAIGRDDLHFSDTFVFDAFYKIGFGATRSPS